MTIKAQSSESARTDAMVGRHLDRAINALDRSEDAGGNEAELRELRTAVRQLVYAIEASR